MAKKTTFTWDKEMDVKMIEVNEYEKREVKVTVKNGKQFVAVTTIKNIKGDWKPVKNATFPMDVWKQIVEAMGDWEIRSAFAGTEDVTVISVEKQKHEEETKPKLKGKKSGVGNQLIAEYRGGGLIEYTGEKYIAITKEETKEYKTKSGAKKFMEKKGYKI